MPIDQTTATFGGTAVELTLSELSVVSDGVQVYLDHTRPNFRSEPVTLEWQVFVDGTAAGSPSPFTPQATRGADRETVPAEPGDVIDVVVTDGSTEVSLSGTVPGESGGGGGGTGPIAEPPEAGEIAVVGCDAPDEVRVGDTAYVSVTVENTGGEQATQSVLISAGGASDETRVTLPAGGSQTVVSGFEFDEGGDYPVTAQVV